MRFCIFFHSLIYQHRLQRRIKQKYMHGLLLVIQTISDFLWGTPMTIALIGTGLYLSIKFKFRYITKIKFHFQNTFPEYITGLIKNIRENCEIPIAVYPNSGEEYDAVKKIWSGKQSALSFEEYAYSYMEAGASAVGGCCTTVAKHVEEVVRAKERFCGK